MFEPQIVKKYQNTVTQDMKEKIISMYAKGMTTNDIESLLKMLYLAMMDITKNGPPPTGLGPDPFAAGDIF